MGAGQWIVNSCRAWLAGGPLGDKLRGDDYRALVSCGFDPALDSPGDIGAVRTSCAVFVRGILHDAGVLRARTRAHAGWPIWGGWLGELGPGHPAWIAADAGVPPTVGAIFHCSLPDHVGIFVDEHMPNLWTTAEGGGGDGTRCDWSGRHIGPDFSTGRLLRGWLDPDLIARSVSSTMPPPAGSRG